MRVKRRTKLRHLNNAFYIKFLFQAQSRYSGISFPEHKQNFHFNMQSLSKTGDYPRDKKISTNLLLEPLTF